MRFFAFNIAPQISIYLVYHVLLYFLYNKCFPISWHLAEAPLRRGQQQLYIARIYFDNLNNNKIAQVIEELLLLFG